MLNSLIKFFARLFAKLKRKKSGDDIVYSTKGNHPLKNDPNAVHRIYDPNKR